MNAIEALGQYLVLVQSNPGLFRDDPPLLARLRQEALGRLPGEIESYRADKTIPAECRPDTMYAPDYGINLQHLEMTADVASAFRCGVPNLNCYLAVVVGDVVHFTDSMLKAPEGLEVYSLRNVPEKYLDMAGISAVAATASMPCCSPTAYISALPRATKSTNQYK